MVGPCPAAPVAPAGPAPAPAPGRNFGVKLASTFLLAKIFHAVKLGFQVLFKLASFQ